MRKQYAKDQPTGFKNHVENIAIIGAGGRIGSYIAKEMIAQGKHKVTALTRPDSTSKLPEGLHAVKKIDYESKESLVEALKEQDVLIITMGVMANPQHMQNLFYAAAGSGVRYGESLTITRT
jgi:putative NADH-flavin reductase